MKRISNLMICAMLMIGACTAVMAQNHRHSERNDSTEEVVLSNAGQNSKATQDLDVDIEEFVNNTVDDALEYVDIHDSDGWATKKMDYSNNITGIIIVFIVFGCIFLGPVLLVAVILFFVYKRKKSRDMVAIAALNNGKDIPNGYGSAPKTSDTSAPKAQSVNREEGVENTIMNRGIRKAAIGAGLWVMDLFIHTQILKGIGLFVAIYGIGQIIIGYLSKEKTSYSSRTYTKPEVTTKEDEKPE